MFEILEHPADIGFRVFAPTLPRLFLNAALALLSIAGDPEAADPRERHVLSVASPDRISLMVDWLNEVLYCFDGKRIAFHNFEMIQFTETALQAAGYGEPRDPVRHQAKLIVKAVTYHQLKIEQRAGHWTAEVFLDI
jgi:SHS2 domain-containing protein